MILDDGASKDNSIFSSQWQDGFLLRRWNQAVEMSRTNNVDKTNVFVIWNFVGFTRERYYGSYSRTQSVVHLSKFIFYYLIAAVMAMLSRKL